MTFTDPPWLMGGGAEHSAEIARSIPYMVSGPYNDLGSPGSFKVQAQDTPDNTVKVMPGTASIHDTHSSNSQGAYVVREAVANSVTIAPTTSAGGRSDLIILKINDPTQRTFANAPGGVAQPGFLFWELAVVSGVPNTTTASWTSNGLYPALVLARIDIPASTATIQNSMIVDLRAKGLAKTETKVFVQYPTAVTHLSISTFDNWPHPWGIWLDIPEWCTNMVVISSMSGLNFSGTVWSDGQIRATLAGQAHPELTLFSHDAKQRFSHVHPTEWAVPESMRGTRQVYCLQGKKNGGNGSFYCEPYTSVVHQVFFQEKAS